MLLFFEKIHNGDLKMYLLFGNAFSLKLKYLEIEIILTVLLHSYFMSLKFRHLIITQPMDFITFISGELYELITI